MQILHFMHIKMQSVQFAWFINLAGFRRKVQHTFAPASTCGWECQHADSEKEPAG